jgi:rod shape-determining protein MreD
VTIGTPTAGVVRALSRGRFTAFALTSILIAILLEGALALGPARPDFAVVILVYGSIRWGAMGGAVLGFGLGILRDVLVLYALGLHAVGMTILGYGVGKLRDTLYLSAPAVDLVLLAGTKLLLDIIVLSATAGAWSTWESRFFWEAPLSALYTAGLGGLAYRLFQS